MLGSHGRNFDASFEIPKASTNRLGRPQNASMHNMRRTKDVPYLLMEVSLVVGILKNHIDAVLGNPLVEEGLDLAEHVRVGRQCPLIRHQLNATANRPWNPSQAVVKWDKDHAAGDVRIRKLTTAP